MVAQAFMDQFPPPAEIHGLGDRDVGGFEVMLHLQHRQPQAGGDVIEAAGRRVFRQKVRCSGTSIASKSWSVFSYSRRLSRRSTTRPSIFCLARLAPRRSVRSASRNAARRAGSGRFLRSGRHFLLVDLVEDLDPLFEIPGVVRLPGERAQIQAGLPRIGVMAGETMVGEEIAGTAREIPRIGGARRPESDQDNNA